MRPCVCRYVESLQKSPARAAASWLQAGAAASFSQLQAQHSVVLPQRQASAHGAGQMHVCQAGVSKGGQELVCEQIDVDSNVD